ncbi:Mannose P dolichol utilization defect 1 protein, partial [Perkinsus sp. BL_2016]
LICVQCAIQCVLYWIISGHVSIPSRIAGSAVLIGVSNLILTRGVPAEYIYILGACPIVLSIWSRLPQIILNFRQGHTGQLALITFALSGLGNLARVFTTIKQTPDDFISLVSMLVSAVLNFTLVVQIIVYWTATLKATASKSSTTRRATSSAKRKQT